MTSAAEQLALHIAQLCTSWTASSPPSDLAYRDHDVQLDLFVAVQHKVIAVGESAAVDMTASATTDPVGFVVAQWLRWLWRCNQFANPSRQWLAKLGAEANAAFAVTNAQQLVEHRKRLALLMAELLDGQTTTSGRYSPALVMAVLGLERIVAAPVLELGCGDGSVLDYLAHAGVTATGFDRDPAGSGGVGDWLTYDYGVSQWATVFSHHAFSLFFRQADVAGSPQANDYAHAYRRILTSLRSGGCFAYYPALPFVERHLPARFMLRKVPLGEEMATAALRLDPSLPAYAAQVIRT